MRQIFTVSKKLATAEPIISTLIKVHAYSILQEEGVLQEWVELKILSKAKETEFYSPPRKRDIFYLLLKESLKTALKAINFLGVIRDLPPTHLPLQLRIYKILRESGKTHQKVGES
jgi:hypothetical protein